MRKMSSTPTLQRSDPSCSPNVPAELTKIVQNSILISSQGRALIGDFGTSRTLVGGRSQPARAPAGKNDILSWAPELLDVDQPGIHSKETDVWAFGMTVYVGGLFFLSLLLPARAHVARIRSSSSGSTRIKA